MYAEENSLGRVKDRLLKAMEAPYIQKAILFAVSVVVGFLSSRGLVFGKYAPFAVAAAAAFPIRSMWAVVLGGVFGYMFPSPVDIPARYVAGLMAVGAIRWSLSELKTVRDHPMFAPTVAFLPLLATGITLILVKERSAAQPLCSWQKLFWRAARHIF